MRKLPDQSQILRRITDSNSRIIFLKHHIENPMRRVVSRPEGLHPRPLSERCGNLSIHTAPIKQTHLPFLVASGQTSYTSHLSMLYGFAVLIPFLLFPVERRIQPLDPTPLLWPHYRPSTLLRVGPSQCSASVRSPRGFYHLCFSLHIGTTGSRSSAREPGSASRLLYAGRRLPSNQVSGRLIPGDGNAPGFDDKSLAYDASSKVHFRSSL